MEFEANWGVDVWRFHRIEPAIRGGRATTARWGARLCLSCGERRPLFFYRGVVKADRDHKLCFACYRAEVNRLRARCLVAVAAGTPIAHPRPRPSKAARDRAALLADIAARRRRAQILARRALEAPAPAREAAALAS